MAGRIENLSGRYEIELPTEKEKPWGYTISIHPESVPAFLTQFFPEKMLGKDPSPRFLVVNAHSRLSWQAHKRRAEFWYVVQGPVGILLSNTDDQPPAFETLHEGACVRIEPNMRHRLIGLDQEGIVAEVWIHTDPNNPSDANDIVRIADDYLR